MDVTMIKVDEKAISVEFSEVVGESLDEHAIKSTDMPLPSLTEAFQALSKDIAQMCELKDLNTNPITVRQISLKKTKEGYSVVLTGLRHFSKTNGGMAVNTPNRYSPLDEDSGSEGHITKACHDRIQRVIAETKQYIAGRRAQLDMFSAGDGAKEEEEVVLSEG